MYIYIETYICISIIIITIIIATLVAVETLLSVKTRSRQIQKRPFLKTTFGTSSKRPRSHNCMSIYGRVTR